MSKFHVIIPARLQSTRLPRKVLLDLLGQSMLQRVYQQACLTGAQSITIATDSDEIAEHARRFTQNVVMTHTDHASGTERIAEVIEKMNFSLDDIIVNLQADEPLMPPALIQQVAQDLSTYPEAGMSTLMTPIHERSEWLDPNCVKVVCDVDGYALYFSRAPIPFEREAGPLTVPVNAFRHLGLYAYRAKTILEYVDMRPTEMESCEKLEQLRFLYYGKKIHMSVAESAPPAGIDTPDDLARVCRYLSEE